MFKRPVWGQRTASRVLVPGTPLLPPFPPARPHLPAHRDVIVVGGGVTGCAATYHLASAGAEVLLLEQFDLNTQASGRNAGSLHGQIQHEPFLHLGEEWARSFLPALAMLVDSVGIWQHLSDQLGVDLEVSTPGGLLIAETNEQMRDIERKVAIEREAGLVVELLGPDDLQRLAPYVSEQMIGGELSRVEGKANSLLAAPAFARAAARLGAKVETYVEVTGVDTDPRGFRLRTSAGATTCRRLVLTAGTNLRGLGAMLGRNLPITAEPVQVSVTETVAPLVKHLVYFAGEKLTLKQARSGSLLIGGGWPARTGPSGTPVMNPQSLRANLRVAQKVVPAVGGAQLLRTWVGVGNGTPDQRPVLGELSGLPGLVVGMFPYMGLTAGPLMGLLVADLVLGRDPGRDLQPFRPDRF